MFDWRFIDIGNLCNLNYNPKSVRNGIAKVQKEGKPELFMSVSRFTGVQLVVSFAPVSQWYCLTTQ